MKPSSQRYGDNDTESFVLQPSRQTYQDRKLNIDRHTSLQSEKIAFQSDLNFKPNYPDVNVGKETLSTDPSVLFDNDDTFVQSDPASNINCVDVDVASSGFIRQKYHESQDSNYINRKDNILNSLGSEGIDSSDAKVSSIPLPPKETCTNLLIPKQLESRAHNDIQLEKYVKTSNSLVMRRLDDLLLSSGTFTSTLSQRLTKHPSKTMGKGQY